MPDCAQLALITHLCPQLGWHCCCWKGDRPGWETKQAHSGPGREREKALGPQGEHAERGQEGLPPEWGLAQHHTTRGLCWPRQPKSGKALGSRLQRRDRTGLGNGPFLYVFFPLYQVGLGLFEDEDTSRGPIFSSFPSGSYRLLCRRHCSKYLNIHHSPSGKVLFLPLSGLS
jgi:hypothetical protein